jgi:hypothetical protein
MHLFLLQGFVGKGKMFVNALAYGLYLIAFYLYITRERQCKFLVSLKGMPGLLNLNALRWDTITNVRLFDADI